MSTTNNNANNAPIAVGTKVLIQGLDKAPQYNYSIGTVIGQGLDRHQVRLQSNPKKVLGIKAEKLTVVPMEDTHRQSQVFRDFVTMATEVVGEGQGKYQQEVEILEALLEVNADPLPLPTRFMISSRPQILLKIFDSYSRHLNNNDKAFEYLAKAAEALHHPYMEMVPVPETSICRIAHQGFGFLVHNCIVGQTDVEKVTEILRVMHNILELTEKVSENEVSYGSRAEMFFTIGTTYRKLNRDRVTVAMMKKADELMQRHSPGKRHVHALVTIPDVLLHEAATNDYPYTKTKELLEEAIAVARTALQLARESNKECVYFVKATLACLLQNSFEGGMVEPTEENYREALTLAEEGLQGALAENDRRAIGTAQYVIDAQRKREHQS